MHHPISQIVHLGSAVMQSVPESFSYTCTFKIYLQYYVNEPSRPRAPPLILQTRRQMFSQLIARTMAQYQPVMRDHPTHCTFSVFLRDEFSGSCHGNQLCP